MKPFLATCAFFGLAACLWAEPTIAAGAPGDDAAKKLVKTAMDRNYMAGDFDAAVQKLKQADAFCEKSGCTPSVRAQIYGALATVHWMGTDEYELAVQDLHTMLRYDPRQPLDATYAPPALREALDTARADLRNTPPESVARAPQTPQAPQPSSSKEEEFRRQVEARKTQAAREAEEERQAADAEAARLLVEQNKAEKIRKQQEAKKAAEDKKEAVRKAAEEKREAIRKAAEEKKAEAIRKVAEAKKAAEDRKEFERKAAEEKKEADRKAAEEKKAEALRKAEEERKAKEDALMRTPPPFSRMQETPWKEQTVGYPIPVAVTIPPPPPRIERPRVEIAKVLVEYYGPSMTIPQQYELKALGGGSYGGLLPCEASSQEGIVTYFTIAINKYENLVSIGASRDKPHKVRIKPVFTGVFPHLPGALPPRVCTAEESRPKPVEGSAPPSAAAPAPGCQTNVDCPDGGVCSNNACATVAAAPPVPTAKRSGGCRRCEAGSDGAPPSGGVALVMCAGAVWLLRKRRRLGAWVR